MLMRHVSYNSAGAEDGSQLLRRALTARFSQEDERGAGLDFGADPDKGVDPGI